MTLIKRDDAVKTVIRKCSPICAWQVGTQQYPDCVVAEINELPSDAVDCTDFIEWLVDRVLDETIWEYNSVAYGEIICRKLEKLGVLEVTEEPSYYIRPSAEAEWIPCSEKLPSDDDWVIVSIDYDRKAHGDNTVYWQNVTIAFYDGTWRSIESIGGESWVTAWMPLPTPYKGGAE